MRIHSVAVWVKNVAYATEIMGAPESVAVPLDFCVFGIFSFAALPWLTDNG